MVAYMQKGQAAWVHIGLEWLGKYEKCCDDGRERRCIIALYSDPPSILTLEFGLPLESGPNIVLHRVNGRLASFINLASTYPYDVVRSMPYVSHPLLWRTRSRTSAARKAVKSSGPSMAICTASGVLVHARFYSHPTNASSGLPDPLEVEYNLCACKV